MLVFEDLHWADGSTLQLIAALARRRAPAKLMLVATCGAGDAEHPQRAMRQNLLMRQLATEVALGPLTQSAVRELLTLELTQEALPQGLTGFVHQHSEGNPLFAIAIVEHLIARRFLIRQEREGALEWQPAGPIEEMEAEVPDRVAQMIELEIQGLSAEEQRVLGAGSVMGIAFPAWAVAAALGEDQAAIEEACAGLARRVHFVERGGQDELPDGTRSEFYVFVHGLYREVLYRQAGRDAAREVAQAHRRAVWRDVSRAGVGGGARGRDASGGRGRVGCGSWGVTARGTSCGSERGCRRGGGAAGRCAAAGRDAGERRPRYESGSAAWDERGRRRDERTRQPKAADRVRKSLTNSGRDLDDRCGAGSLAWLQCRRNAYAIDTPKDFPGIGSCSDGRADRQQRVG